MGKTEVQGSHPGQLLRWLLVAVVLSVDVSKTENFKEGLEKIIIWEFIRLELISKPQPGYTLSIPSWILKLQPNAPHFGAAGWRGCQRRKRCPLPLDTLH